MSKGTEKGVKITEITSFNLFFKHFVFNVDADGLREKIMKDTITVRLTINLECGDMLNL